MLGEPLLGGSSFTRALPLPLALALALGGCRRQLSCLLLGLLPARAQVETFMLQRGSNIGPETKVIPTNCVSASDGSVSCDTQIINPPSASPAKPQFQPFKN